MPERKRCCCNCVHDLRILKPYLGTGFNTIVDHNECEIDGHHIGYLECFDGWCKHWKKAKKQ